MEKKLVITSVKKINSTIKFNEQGGFNEEGIPVTRSGELSFDLEINVRGAGNFSEYVKDNKTFDVDDFLMDVLLGKIKIVGIKS